MGDFPYSELEIIANNKYWADLTYSKAAPSFDVAEDQADEDSNEPSNTGPQ